MKKVCVVTSTRADYGILRPLLVRLKEQEEIILTIVATGMHLCSEFGYTYQEIEKDGFQIYKKIDIQMSVDTAAGMSKTMGIALICFADYFHDELPDLLIVLGDRFEIAAVCSAAVNQQIPIAHIHGGELTEGAIDDCYRHSITKMSSLHFVSCEPYRRRVIQLGENPESVFNVGAMSIENILSMQEYPLIDLENDIQFHLCNQPYVVVTFHPVTTECDFGAGQVTELIKAIDEFPELNFLITKANSDAGGRAINRMWDEYSTKRTNSLVVSSLGSKRYLTALKNAKMMLGNSSSGIIEGPACKIPVINIGNRQKGRIASESVIHCNPNQKEISLAIRTAMLPSLQDMASNTTNPYGIGNTSEKILNEIIIFLKSDKTQRAKKFFDCFEGNL